MWSRGPLAWEQHPKNPGLLGVKEFLKRAFVSSDHSAEMIGDRELVEDDRCQLCDVTVLGVPGTGRIFACHGFR